MPISQEFLDEMFLDIHADDLTSDRFLAMPEAERTKLVAQSKEQMRQSLDRLAAKIEARDIDLHCGHTFHPTNRFYRRIFGLLTGLTLPAGANATRNFVADWIGRDKVDAAEAARKAARDAKDAAAAAKRDEAELAGQKAAAERVARGEAVSGDELVDVCRYLKIDVHPRTVGSLRQRVRSVKADQSTFTGKGRPSAEVYRLYRQCQEILTKN